MEKHRTQRRARHLVATAAATAGLATLGTSEANASLFLDLRASGATTTAPGVLDPKTVVVANTGDTVTLSLFARVTGTDGVNNETFNSVYGLLNSVGSLLGNLSGGPAVPFRDSSFQNGSVMDWDSDGDLDIGMSPTHSGSTGKYFARNATSGGMPMQTIVDVQSSESRIGEFVFTLTPSIGFATDVNFTIRNNNGNNINGGGSALWFEDGQSTSKSVSNSPHSIGLAVHVTVEPEPSSIGLMALGGLGLLKRRARTLGCANARQNAPA